ncbi:Superoxide dismutase [Cu-Zn], partial [Stegodyphus mimosarum]
MSPCNFVTLFCLTVFWATSRAALPIEQVTRSRGQDDCNIKSAICRIHNRTASGVITLKYRRPGGPVSVSGQIKGLSSGLHGFHVHQYGDLSNGCTSAGGHYNPYGLDHGAPTDAVRHVGDLGNIEADNNGIANVDIVDNELRLCGPLSILGRAIVIHERADDLGRGGNPESKKTGNAGSRLACCVIGTAPSS